MKHLFRWLVAVMLASLVIPTAYSQSFGFKAGLNISNMVYHPDKGGSRHYQMHPGYHLGIITNIPFSAKISLETDLYLSTKGINVTHEKLNGFSPEKGNLNLLYLDIPIMVKVFLSQNTTKPYLVAGPYVGFGISGKSTVKGETQPIHFGGAYDEDFRDLDFGATLGVGMEVNGFLVGLNYDVGLINMFSHDDMGGKVYNRNLRLSVGYILPNKNGRSKSVKTKQQKNGTTEWWK